MQDSYKQSFKREESGTLGISIYNCGLQSCEPGHTWGPGVRNHYLIHLVTSGKGEYHTEAGRFSLCAGDLFLARPSQRITYRADGADPWEYYWVGFNGAFAGQLVQQLPFTAQQPCHRCERPDAARAVLGEVFSAHGHRPHNEYRMAGHLYLFASLLMEENAGSGARPPDTASQYLDAAIKYIQHNYAHDISVDDIAHAVGLSRSHLYRVFMNSIGTSPIDYLTHFRIGEACALLEKTTLSIAEVACSVGFFDQFYFSRVFKKVKGCPPSKYTRVAVGSAVGGA